MLEVNANYNQKKRRKEKKKKRRRKLAVGKLKKN
jgi:hypothetical protein